MTHLEKLEQKYTKETGKMALFIGESRAYTREFVQWLSARDVQRVKLPSDEEINKQGRAEFPDFDENAERMGFRCGAKWMRDKLKGTGQ